MFRAHWAWLAGLAFVVGAATFVASCSSAREAIGISSAPVTVSSVWSVPPKMAEISGDWSPDGAVLLDGAVLTSDRIALGYNDWVNNEFGWAWSDNRGVTWTKCSANNPGSCNAPFGAFDTGFGQSWISDPTIVTDRRGRAVWVSIANPNPNNAGACTGDRSGGANVVAIVSHDGGRTFDPNTITVVNDTACSNGCQDQPDASWDFTTNPPTLWVAFRHAGVTPGNHGACARRYFLDATDHLQPLDIAYDVNTVAGSQTGYGIGAVRIRAGGGMVTVAYGRTENVSGCPGTSLSNVGVGTVSSADGTIWSNNDVIIDTGSTFPGCTLTQQVAMDKNPRNFDFVRTIDGTNYIVFQDTKSTLRLYMDRVFGAQPSGRGESEWREWCAGTATADAGSLTPITNWGPRGTACSTPFYSQVSGNSLALPTIAADDQGRLAVTVYEADSTDTLFHVHFRDNVAPRDPSSSWQDTDITANFRPGFNNGDGRELGDYEAMIVRSSFRQPSCGGVGTFFPAFTVADAAAPDATDLDQWAATVEVTFP